MRKYIIITQLFIIASDLFQECIGFPAVSAAVSVHQKHFGPDPERRARQ